MISLKCKNCAGEMSIDLKGEIACPYCGSKEHLSDIEFRGYKEFRLNLLNYLRAAADASNDEADGTFLWNYHEKAHYKAANGSQISIDYLFYSIEDDVESYVAKDSVVYIFKAKDTDKAERFKRGLLMLDYPSAALKDLSKYFPTIKASIDLDDGGKLIAITKPENVYPLYAFGNLKPVHVAWIVSRLENLSCVFEFSEIVHNGISINSVFINPKTHEAFLYGGWWSSRKKLNSSEKNDLLALRKVAKSVMGEYINEAPPLFVKFIDGIPSSDAYTDFEKWDEVIEKGFGGHKFTSFKKEG